MLSIRRYCTKVLLSIQTVAILPELPAKLSSLPTSSNVNHQMKTTGSPINSENSKKESQITGKLIVESMVM